MMELFVQTYLLTLSGHNLTRCALLMEQILFGKLEDRRMRVLVYFVLQLLAVRVLLSQILVWVHGACGHGFWNMLSVGSHSSF